MIGPKTAGEKTIVELAPSILVVTDLSEASSDALSWADELAQKYKANLKVLYPYRFNQLKGKDNLVLLKEKMETEANNKFNAIAQRVFNNGNTKYDFEVEVGFINDRVDSFIRKNDVLFVVISKETVNNNKEALSDLINDLRVPLLIVPHINESHQSINPPMQTTKRSKR